MPSYSVAEARDRLPALLVAVERGEAVTITRRGKPIANLTPVEQAALPADPAAMAAILDRLAWVPYSSEDSVAQLEAIRSARDF